MGCNAESVVRTVFHALLWACSELNQVDQALTTRGSPKLSQLDVSGVLHVFALTAGSGPSQPTSSA